MKTWIVTTIGMVVALFSSATSAQPARGNSLAITSPSGGTVVTPGQTISVSVVVNSGTYPNGIGIVGGQDGGGTMMIAGPLSGSSLTFAVTIPADALPGPLGISATGTDASGTLDASAEVSLDVERTDTPVSLRVSPPSFHVQQGQSLPLTVFGVYADGSWQGLTESSRLQTSSSNTVVATVQNGSVVAGEPGNANIQISYDGLTATVPVVVAGSGGCFPAKNRKP